MKRIGPRDEDDSETNDGYDRRTFLTGVGSITAGGLLGASGLATLPSGGEFDPTGGELIVGFSPAVSDVLETAQSALPDAVEIVHSNDAISYVTVSLPAVSERARDRALEAIAASEHVAYAEPNATFEAFARPNDSDYGAQHAPTQIGCETAWETTYGSEDVTIAVVDHGVQHDHPDLEGTVAGPGTNLVDPGSDPYPVGRGDSHGTHVAGIAVGRTDNGVGTAGISDCSLLVARALDANGSGSLSAISDGIQWAADNGADVINVSFGAPRSYETLANACDYALEQGALVIAAAGNAGSRNVMYPAAYRDVLAVSALDGERMAAYSNTGPEVDIAAPGTDVLSAVPWDDYDRISGTSMASPVVAGVAGLVLSAHPDLTPIELRDHLRATATDLGLGETRQGAGRVDAAAAIETDPVRSEEAAGECGDETVVARADGNLTGGWWGQSDRYTYAPRTSDPCSATITLEEPAAADFDLYVNVDGTVPTRWSHDEASSDDGGTETLELELSGDEDLRLRVHADNGSGDYTLRIEERGR